MTPMRAYYNSNQYRIDRRVKWADTHINRISNATHLCSTCKVEVKAGHVDCGCCAKRKRG